MGKMDDFFGEGNANYHKLSINYLVIKLLNNYWQFAFLYSTIYSAIFVSPKITRSSNKAYLPRSSHDLYSAHCPFRRPIRRLA